MKSLNIFLVLFLLLLYFDCAFPQAVIKSIPAPGLDSRGLAWDGSHIWIADSRMDSVYQILVENGSVTSKFYFDILEDYGGLAWAEDSTLWLANGDSIFNLDPLTGHILKGFMAPGC